MCSLLWSIADSCLCITLCDCSPSCFDPNSLLLAYLWLVLSWIGCISTRNNFPHQTQAAGTLHQQQAAGKAQQKHSVEMTIKPSWGSVAPLDPTLIRENRYSRSHTYSETRAAIGNSGSIGSSSICMRTLRSVSWIGNVVSSLWRTSANVERFFTICFTCFCKTFFLHERFKSEHLVATST